MNVPPASMGVCKLPTDQLLLPLDGFAQLLLAVRNRDAPPPHLEPLGELSDCPPATMSRTVFNAFAQMTRVHGAVRVAVVVLALGLARVRTVAGECSCAGGQYKIDDADCRDNILCTACPTCSVPCCTASSHWANLAPASPWAPRVGHAVISAPLLGDGGSSTAVLVLGGRLNASMLLNDVWETRDGRTWTAHTFDKIWSPRAFFGAVAVGPARVFVMGGVAEDERPGGNGAGRKRALNDVWLWRRDAADGIHLRASTADGAHLGETRAKTSGAWVELVAAAQWSARARFGLGFLPAFPPPCANETSTATASLGGKMYVLGGERPQGADDCSCSHTHARTHARTHALFCPRRCWWKPGVDVHGGSRQLYACRGTSKCQQHHHGR